MQNSKTNEANPVSGTFYAILPSNGTRARRARTGQCEPRIWSVEHIESELHLFDLLRI